jgi:hypothetical protein
MTPKTLKAATTQRLDERKEFLLEQIDAVQRELWELERREKNCRIEIRRINRELETRRTLPK